MTDDLSADGTALKKKGKVSRHLALTHTHTQTHTRM